MTELVKNGRRQYLVTYSKADLVKFLTRESFANAVVKEFNFGTSVVKVQHWACCREKHEDGSDHYHLCLKLATLSNGIRGRHSETEIRIAHAQKWGFPYRKPPRCILELHFFKTTISYHQSWHKNV